VLYESFLERQKPLKLIDILGHKDNISIDYRTLTPEGDDIYTGGCYYSNGTLQSRDGEYYDLDDEFVDYEYNGNNLTVWYESRWISG